MFPPRKDPYQTLIEQFIQNNQEMPAQNEQRFIRQREERLVEEERSHQEEIRREGYARQDSLEAQRREDALTDQANTIMQREAQQIRSAMAYLDPDSEEFASARQAVEILTRPTNLTGQAALDQALYGQYESEDGYQISTHDVVSRLDRLRRSMERDEGMQEGARQMIFNRLADDSVPTNDRRQLYNLAVLDSTLFNDDMKRAILPLLEYEDPEKIEEIVLRNDALELQVDTARRNLDLLDLQIDRERFGFEQDQRLADLTYDTAQAQYENLLASTEGQRAANAVTRRDAFLQLGLTPTDDERATQMAIDLGYEDADALRRAGAAVFARAQDRQRLADDIQRQQFHLVGRQIKTEELSYQMQRLQYDREAVYGDLMAQLNVGEIALAAAMQGDTSILNMMKDMNETGADGGAFDVIAFDSLFARAEAINSHGEAQREYQRGMWTRDAQNSALMYETNLQDFIQTVGGTRFVDSDFEVGDDGTAPIERDIEDYLDMMPGGLPGRLGLTREELGERLLHEARIANYTQDQAAAQSVLTMLESTAPHAEPTYDDQGVPMEPGPDTPLTTEQERWRSMFLSTAREADMDPEVAEEMARGILAGANLDYWRARLDGENVESQIRERLANARVRAAEAAQLENPMDALEVTDQDVAEFRQAINLRISTLQGLLDSSVCTVAAPSGGGYLNPKRQDECIGYRDDMLAERERLNTMGAAYGAYQAGNPQPWITFATTFDSDVPTIEPGIEGAGSTEEVATAYESLRATDGVKLGEVDTLRSADPETYNAIMRAWNGGYFGNVGDLNAAVGLALTEAEQTGRAGAEQEDMSVGEIAISEGLSERANLQLGGKLIGDLARDEEWLGLVERLANREETFESLDRRALASQFGFTLPNHVIGFRLPNTPYDEPDVDTFEWALRTSLRSYLRAEDSSGDSSPPPQAPPETPLQQAPSEPTPPQEGGEQQETAQWQRPTIMIDAGHGIPNSQGIIDNGAHNQADGTLEGHLNLTAAERITTALGDIANPLMARTGEEGSVYTDRVQLANDSGAEAYVSVHHDSANSPEPVGVYHNDTEEGIRLAEAIAASLGEEAWVRSHTEYSAGRLYIAGFKGPGVLVELGPTQRVPNSVMDDRAARVRDGIATWSTERATLAVDPRAAPRSGPAPQAVRGR